jgi:hypothetical protein
LRPRLLSKFTNNNLINDSNDSSILLTWKDVLHGRMTGIQVWRKRVKQYRDVYSTFKARKKRLSGLKSILNYLYPEVFGDQIQLFHLLNGYYKSNSEHQSTLVKVNQSKMNQIQAPIKLQGQSFQSLLQRIDSVFKNAIREIYSNFNVYGKPLLTSNEVDMINKDYMTNFSDHYNQMKEMLQFNKKENRIRNYHLSSNNYYNRRLLYIFLSQSRMVHNHNLVHFGIVNTGACYARGLTSKALTLSIHSGISTTYNTMMIKIKEYADSMDKKLMDLLSQHNRFVVVMDNNQKGHPIKYQRGGNSNDFIVVTGRMHRECHRFIIPENHYQLSATVQQRCPLVYINQPIPSMYHMPTFELINNDASSSSNVIMNISSISTNMGHIDFSGHRVWRYNHLLSICDVVSNVIFKTFSNYKLNKTRNIQYKEWLFQPRQYNTDSRHEVTKNMTILKNRGILKQYASFQANVMNIVDRNIRKATKMFVPGVSIRNEITTNGYGMAIIEVLVSVGILKQIKHVENGTSSWGLCDDYHKKKLILCMDGLSLDRHRSFKKKLMKIPQSFKNNFKQSLVFQKALGQVIETSGPLHIAFHMLQTIFDIYKHLINWSINIVEWKRIKKNKVSDCFQLSKQLIMLVLNEAERYLVDVMFHYYMSDDKKRQCTEDNATSVYIFATCYLEFLDDNSWSANNKYRQMIKSFVKTGRKFRRYWSAIRNGDRQSQELIFNEWMGVFSLLNKHNYLEICLNSIEKEYGEVEYSDLEEIRINGYIRSTEGFDKDDKAFTCLALDEKQEELNWHTKQLPIGNSIESWLQHSRNLMFARSCMSQVEMNYTRRHLSHSNNSLIPIVAKNNDVSDHTRTVIPSSTREKIRLYEFLILLLDDETNNTHSNMSMQHGKNLITKLTTSLSNDTEVDAFSSNQDGDDHLADCIENIFRVEDSLDITLNNDVLNDSQNEGTSNEMNDETHVPLHTTISTLDIFVEGNKHLLEKNIIEIRKRRKKRLQREYNFYMKVNDIVTNNALATSIALNSINNVNDMNNNECLLFQQNYDSLN